MNNFLPHRIAKDYSREAVACLLGLFLFVYWLLELRRPLGDVVTLFIEDDACYYMSVARNWTDGFGFTFDRLNQTNGFHPLWMISLYPIFRCFGGVEAPFRVMLIGSFIVVFASLVGLAALCRQLKVSLTATIGALGMLILAAKHRLFGVEAWLAVMLMIAVLLMAARARVLEENQATHRSAYSVLGALLGLLFLARLDSVIIMAPFAAWVCINISSRGNMALQEKITTLVAFCLPFTMMMGAYFLWNYATFHALSPISSAIKSNFPHFNHPFPRYTTIRYAIPIVAMFSGAWVIIRTKDEHRKALARVVFSLGIGIAIHVLYLELFQTGVQIWYFATQYIALALSAALVIDEVFQQTDLRGYSKGLLQAGVFCVAILCLLRVCRAYPMSGSIVHDSDYEMGIWAKGNTPKDSIFGMSWSGKFGYFSERRTINLDGLINGYAYKTAIERGAFDSFLRSSGVDYLAGEGWFPPQFAAGNYDEWTVRPLWETGCPAENYATVHRVDEIYRGRYHGVDSVDHGVDTRWNILWKYRAKGNE